MKEIPEPIDFGDDIPTLENESPIETSAFEPLENRVVNEGDVLIRTHLSNSREFTTGRHYKVCRYGNRLGILDDNQDLVFIDLLMQSRWGVLVDGPTKKPMTPDEYVDAAMTTASDLYKSTFSAHSMGLMIEAAEYSDLMHKAYHHDKEIKSEDIVSELGDIAWMLACACHFHRVKLSDVMQGNLDKLKKRHSNKYNADHYRGVK